VIGPCRARHRHQEFIRFLNRINRETPAVKVREFRDHSVRSQHARPDGASIKAAPIRAIALRSGATPPGI
jgi:hypothetical protein